MNFYDCIFNPFNLKSFLIKVSTFQILETPDYKLKFTMAYKFKPDSIKCAFLNQYKMKLQINYLTNLISYLGINKYKVQHDL